MMLRRTLVLLIVCGIVAFLVLAVRLFQLQIIEHDFYEKQAIGQQVRGTVVTAHRGTIYDTNGKILAMSASVDMIILSPRDLWMNDIIDPGNENSPGKLTADFIAAGIGEILDIEPESILKKMENTKSMYQVVARKVEPEISDQLRRFKDEYGITGLHIEEDTKRYYPYSSLAAQVIGFVGTDNDGLYGLEAVYNDQLSGVNGRVVRLKNNAGTDMLFTNFEDYYDAIDGYDTHITIDSNIQYYMEKILAQAVIDYDAQNGAGAIAMDVKTGAILAMVSLGNFDLNNYQVVPEEVQQLIDAEQDPDIRAQMLSDAQFNMWKNKTITDTYEPGSTFKIITLAMALNEGIVNENSTFYCPGFISIPTRVDPINCWKDGGHGSQTLTQALQHSCNVAFVQIGMSVGAPTFYNYAEAFGFFENQGDGEARLSGSTGIDLQGESRSLWWPENYFVNPNNVNSLAVASFGQTFTITPLQLITAVSACVNGGYLMQPYMVEQIVDNEGNVISKTEPTVIRQVLSEDTSRRLNVMLEQVVGGAEGTGRNAAVAGYRIGGKTGTSNNTVMEALTGTTEYIVSFVGVAPMDDPQIAILAFIDSPSNASGIYISGGQMGAPTVGKMFADILPYLGIDPVYSENEAAVRDRAVPNIIGLTAGEAGNKLKEAGFDYRVIGEGSAVTAQLPAANSTIAAGSQVILYCDSAPGEGTAVMPDLSNMSYSVARQILGAEALFIRASGPITDPMQIVVVNQSVEAGTVLDFGTVIEVGVIDKRDQDVR
jgi:stage V sporulation protein D (sporulation-specific penicillin-binding protein)